MNQVLVFIGGVILGVSGFWVWVKKDKIEKNKKVPELVLRQAKEKAEHKQKILELLASRQKVSNNDVQKELGVSDATVTRYMEELEKEGKVRQVGKTGQSVFYEKM